MSSSYFYKGINISELVKNGATTIPGYIGFPPSFLPSCNSTGFDKPSLFSYSYQGTDVSNSTTAIYQVTGNTDNDGGNGIIPLSIPGTNSKYNYVSICCSGGGGGGGGAGSGTNVTGGGDGGPGGNGAYAAVLNCPVSNISEINYSFGSGGESGNANNQTSPGEHGNSGGETTVYLGPIGNIVSPGGNGGKGGLSTPGVEKGQAGEAGNTPSSTINFSNYTSAITKIYDTPTYTPLNYPPQNQTFSPDKGNGALGVGGKGEAGPLASNGGKPGNAGFVLVYLSV